MFPMKTNIIKIIQALAISVSVAPCVVKSESLIGRTIGYQYYFPNLQTIYYNPAPFLVTAGVELPALYNSGNDVATVDVTENGLVCDFYLDVGPWSERDFNGFRLFDATGTIWDFSSVTIAPETNMPGLNLSRISFDANNLYVNWQGLFYDSNTVVSIAIDFAPIPEPASWCLFAGGIVISLALARRRPRSRHAEAAENRA
jgi:hypothetical protein